MFSTVIFAAAAAITLPNIPEQSRENMLAQYRGVLATWDQDSDKRLSYAEINTMIDTGLRSPVPLAPEERAHFVKEMRQFYLSRDTNGDGYVSEDELLSAASQLFDCLDIDKNDKISPAETTSETARCMPS
jgi:Ca2+-binding EF-hand superfamily protein